MLKSNIYPEHNNNHLDYNLINNQKSYIEFSQSNEYSLP